ncbi:unnamed protein product [Dovyalis caffra]|uniref:Peptidase S8/S53 domain-containing protein n=1 Tax=Dovyalis caffra TaxID=77055 RepID=A0AAV1QST4_9ROSI|nr:unnamed protein product [Dovyalis caffra]
MLKIFSNDDAPAILKVLIYLLFSPWRKGSVATDMAAPGVSILATSSPAYPFEAGGFSILAGTSFSTPYFSEIVALLKAIHPYWSPSAIKSAIVTTAWKTDPHGEPILAKGSSRKLADPPIHSTLEVAWKSNNLFKYETLYFGCQSTFHYSSKPEQVSGPD